MLSTFTRRSVDPLALRPEDIDIRDIAHHLALCNRFAGGTRWPISVAQHSVYVSLVVGTTMDDSVERYGRTVLEALLHDASEAYLGDVTKWLKATPEMAAYRKAEDAAQRTIYAKFNCLPPWEMSPEVEVADRLMVRYEAWKSYGPEMPMFQRPDYPVPSKQERDLINRVAGRPWTPWTWQKAQEDFLKRFYQLTS